MSYKGLRLHMRYVAPSLVAICLVSCAGTVSPTMLPITPSETATAKLLLTETLVPTLSSTVSPEPSLSGYDLPDWLANPAVDIMAAIMADGNVQDSYRMDFYNAATGENYDIKIPENVRGYFWYDSSHFGFLIDDLQSLQIIDLKTGQTSQISLRPEALRLWNLEFENYKISERQLVSLEIIRDDAGGVALIEPRTWLSERKSKSKLFNAEWNVDKNILTIIDTSNRQTIWEEKLPPHTYGTEFVWSPIHENWLAFVQAEPDINPDVSHEFKISTMKLIIVDVVSKKTLWTFNGDFGMLAWSPDGEKILYRNNASRYSNYGVGFQDAPCILFFEQGIKRCLRSIPRFVPDGFALSTTGLYEWSSDSESIFYVYEYYLLESNGYRQLSNLCIYSLIDGHIQCPTQNLKELQGRSVISYTVSSHRQFVYFCYSDQSLLSDAADDSDNGMIRVDGTGFLSRPGTLQDGGPKYCSGGIWRPLP